MTLNLHGTTSVDSLTSRFYETEDDFRQMQGLLMEGRSRTDDWHYWHVGDLMWWFFMVTCHLNPHEHIRLWHDDAGRLVAYAILGEDPSYDCHVLPEYEWAGIETEALAWADSRLAELRRHHPQRWSGNLVSGARLSDGRRVAFLEQHGFRRGAYTEVNMICPLDGPVAEPVLPEGCQLRAMAEAGELSNLAAAQRDVWHEWTVGQVSDDDYARFMRLPGYHRDLDLVVVAPDGVIAAYVNGWIDPVNRIGDFGPVGARLAYRRRGFTRAVLLEGLRRMQEYGMNRASVSTGESNLAAQGLYESVGFKVVNKYLTYVKIEAP
jgi:ribosomal protein S18 acetylase RimI-like enzyme